MCPTFLQQYALVSILNNTLVFMGFLVVFVLVFFQMAFEKVRGNFPCTRKSVLHPHSHLCYRMNQHQAHSGERTSEVRAPSNKAICLYPNFAVSQQTKVRTFSTTIFILKMQSSDTKYSDFIMLTCNSLFLLHLLE